MCLEFSVSEELLQDLPPVSLGNLKMLHRKPDLAVCSLFVPKGRHGSKNISMKTHTGIEFNECSGTRLVQHNVAMAQLQRLRRGGGISDL